MWLYRLNCFSIMSVAHCAGDDDDPELGTADGTGDRITWQHTPSSLVQPATLLNE